MTTAALGVVQMAMSDVLEENVAKAIGFVREAARRGATAVLRVRDQGIGIDPVDHARIFGPFERAVSERNYSGFGVGLWAVERIITAHGGSIRVDSALGKGATFTVHLPTTPHSEPETVH